MSKLHMGLVREVGDCFDRELFCLFCQKKSLAKFFFANFLFWH